MSDKFKFSGTQEDVQQVLRVVDKSHRVVPRLLTTVLQHSSLSEQLALAELLHVFGDAIIEMPASGQPVLGKLLKHLGEDVAQRAETEAARGEASDAQCSHVFQLPTCWTP